MSSSGSLDGAFVLLWLCTWYRGNRRPVGSRDGAAPSRRLLLRHYVRWALLFLPTLLAAFYYFFIAADRYESEARFVVRSASRP
jgi:hypothetical protein